MIIIFKISVVELKCAVQSYAWGKIGLDSTVAQLSQHSPSFELEEDKPYAEVCYEYLHVSFKDKGKVSKVIEKVQLLKLFS